MTDEGQPWRLEIDRLAIPGVIGAREPRGISFGAVPHVLLGESAGFPEFQSLDEWKTDMALVDARALSPATRAEVGLRLPEEELAELAATAALFADLDLPPMDDGREVDALRLAARARLHPLTEAQAQALEVRGLPFWRAGFTRHSYDLWVHRVGGDAPVQEWTSFAGPCEREAPCPPPWMSEKALWELFWVRWPDRVLRALSGGEVSEAALLFAKRQWAQMGTGMWPSPSRITDDVARAGLAAAAQMAAGAAAVELPLHGLARRVRLPAFAQPLWEADPRTSAGPTRQVFVPAEDAWLLEPG